jgi:UPF0755 protein
MGVRRFLAIVLSVALLAGLGYGSWYVYHGLFEDKDLGEEGAIFTIEPGAHLDEIAYSLQEGGHIRSDIVFSLYARLRGAEASLQAGKYHLAGGMSGREVLEKIVSGDAVFDEIEITIPEGFTIEQIAARLESVGLFEAQAFEIAARMAPVYEDFWVLEGVAPGTLLEGYLFPDTYRVFADSTPQTVVARMVRRLQQALAGELIADIRRDQLSLHELITLASIVQKESPPEDMPLIAGVFRNRLEAGRLLESDATVNYALGTSKRQPTFADTRVEHPFNTYRNQGLPPAPIGSPGRAAIDATVHAAEHDYYFFLHKPTEETVLSRTFAEHLAAKRRYLD